MVEINISELTFDNLGSWPLPIKVAAILLVFVGLIGAGYWFDTKVQLEHLSRVKQKEKNLRQQFEAKQHHASNLHSYREQLEQMQVSFGAMLRQLPSKTEVPGLLEDISKTGVASGLEFKLFDPLQESQHDFYAELPITISVIGDYYQLGSFVSRVAALDRIVTLHDLEITLSTAGSGAGKRKSSKKNQRKRSPYQLKMDITAKTYRYTEGRE